MANLQRRIFRRAGPLFARDEWDERVTNCKDGVMDGCAMWAIGRLASETFSVRSEHHQRGVVLESSSREVSDGLAQSREERRRATGAMFDRELHETIVAEFFLGLRSRLGDA